MNDSYLSEATKKLIKAEVDRETRILKEILTLTKESALLAKRQCELLEEELRRNKQ